MILIVVLLQTLATVEPLPGAPMSRDHFAPVTGKESTDPSNSVAIGGLYRLRSPDNMIEAGFAAYEEHRRLTN
jgi:hypothetical protein